MGYRTWLTTTGRTGHFRQTLSRPPVVMPTIKRVSVEIPDGSTLEFKVASSWRVSDLKNRVFDRLHVNRALAANWRLGVSPVSTATLLRNLLYHGQPSRRESGAPGGMKAAGSIQKCLGSLLPRLR